MECYGRVANGIGIGGRRYLAQAKSLKASIQMESWLKSGGSSGQVCLSLTAKSPVLNI